MKPFFRTFSSSGWEKLEHPLVGLQELEREIRRPRHEAGKKGREDRSARIVVGREPERLPTCAVVLVRITPDAADSRLTTFHVEKWRTSSGFFSLQDCNYRN